MDKQKQILEMAKLDIEESASGYSAFINDMRISKSKPFSVSKTIMSFDCPKKYILSAIGIPENAVVLTREEYQKYLAFKIIEPQVRGCLDREKKLQKQVETISKKTAEKFKKLLKALVVERNCNEDYDWEDVQIDGQIFIECVDEICKEIIGEGK